MKWRFRYFYSLTVSLALVIGVGCAKKASDPEIPAASPVTPDPAVTDDRGTGSTPIQLGGATVDFVPSANFYQYASVNHPLNAPKDYKLQVKLSDIGGGKYAGSVVVSYIDNNLYNWGHFQSGQGTVKISTRDTGKNEAEFNRWFKWQGKSVFHGFFQDKWGSIVLVVDSSLSLGDGAGLSNLGGKVYFKNFPNVMPTQEQYVMGGTYNEKCWFRLGLNPYKCRTFLVGPDIVTTSALYPVAEDGYQVLGTFSGMNSTQGFSQ